MKITEESALSVVEWIGSCVGGLLTADSSVIVRRILATAAVGVACAALIDKRLIG